MSDVPGGLPVEVLTRDDAAGVGVGPAGLRATIELAPIGLAQFDASGRFLLVNDRLCEILGYGRADLLARTFQEITFPEDLAHCLSLNASLAAKELPSYELEKRFVRTDGSIVWARITVSAVRRPDGAPAFFIGAAEDITAQVTATRALRLAEERLQAALGASRIGTFRFDVRENRLEWADGLERVFGSGERITLEQFFEAIHPDDRTAVMAAYQRSVADGVDFEEEFRVVWPDGSVHWLHDHGRTVNGADGRPHYIDGAITDISTHKHLEARYRRALDVETIGVIFFDNRHRVTGINPAFARMSGAGRDQLAGAVAWLELTSAGARAAAAAGAAEFDATGRISPCELEFTRPDGSRWWALVTATRVGDGEGVAFVLDLTTRKHVEHEREEVLRLEQTARGEAEHATAVRQQVLGFVAHDLRNPLQAVLLSASALLELPLPPEQRTRRIELIKRCALEMDRLIADLVDVSRIEAGTFAVRREPLSIPPLVAEVAESFQEQARAREVRLVTRIEADIPPVPGDEGRLAQALSNLVSNAIKFTPPGGEVVLGARGTADHLDLFVQDTGCGIAGENLASIFERFWQAKKTEGGAGLGLAIVKGIVDAHDGRIQVESEPGRGTTFQVRLPLTMTQADSRRRP